MSATEPESSQVVSDTQIVALPVLRIGNLWIGPRRPVPVTIVYDHSDRSFRFLDHLSNPLPNDRIQHYGGAQVAESMERLRHLFETRSIISDRARRRQAAGGSPSDEATAVPSAATTRSDGSSRLPVGSQTTSVFRSNKDKVSEALARLKEVERSKRKTAASTDTLTPQPATATPPPQPSPSATRPPAPPG